jgi:multidrug efflux pump
VLGALPLAISAGAGSASRSAIGWVIVGGMTLGTLFTLFIIPVAYTYIVGEHRAVASGEEGGGTVAHTPAGKA